MKLVKTPSVLHRLYPNRIWAMPREEQKVYLTFDDGPIPEVTPWVLDELNKHQAKATFFCIGDNVRKHPDIFERIQKEGHSVGNHTFNHLNGWKTDKSVYLDNIAKSQQVMEVHGFSNKSYDKPLFRPPYGRITSKQADVVQEIGYQIVMWEIISFDYDVTVSPEKCLSNVLDNLQAGSVIVFHDSLKAEGNLRYVLPRVLESIAERGWVGSRL